MTKIAGFMTLFMLGLIAALTISGFSGSAASLTLGVLCAVPLFMLFLGFTVGRASNEFSITRRERPPVVSRTTRSQTSRVREPLG